MSKPINVIGDDMQDVPVPTQKSQYPGPKFADSDATGMDLVIGIDLGGPEGILINDLGRG